MIIVFPLCLGSSPRMRGARYWHEFCWIIIGIIPADAGSTYKPWRVSAEWRDHPRGCGEHSVIPKLRIVRVGSSPRMRGAHPELVVDEAAQRIIPADAGSTHLCCR